MAHASALLQGPKDQPIPDALGEVARAQGLLRHGSHIGRVSIHSPDFQSGSLLDRTNSGLRLQSSI